MKKLTIAQVEANVLGGITRSEKYKIANLNGIACNLLAHVHLLGRSTWCLDLKVRAQGLLHKR